MKSQKKTRLNDEIRVPKVRLIDADGEQLGIVDIRTALEKARAAKLDLVEIAPNAEPPVCRVMDYGKYVFQARKSQAKKPQPKQQVKEIKFRPTIEQADYEVKLRNIARFLRHGDKVKVTIRFRGREVTHQEFGLSVLERVQHDLVDLGEVDQLPKMEGRQLVMMIVPAKAGQKKQPKEEMGEDNAKIEK